MSSTTSRPVHPCVLSVWEGNPGGAEYSTWAHLSSSKDSVAHLVTAQGSTLTVYSLDDATGKLLIQHKFTNLAGTVCFLATLKTSKGADSLLIGFAGYPRLSVVTVTPDLLLATSLLDLTVALQEACYGATSPFEQDLQASLFQTSNDNSRATLSVILGGGIAVACLELTHSRGGWSSSEPYLLPLPTLSSAIHESTAIAASTAGGATQSSSIATGFGDILSVAFLPGYSEPTLVLLHSSLSGQTWSGRLGRTEGGTRNGLVVTAITVTVAHERSAVLWSTEVPSDARHVYCATPSKEQGSGGGGCLVHCVNAIVAISNTGQIQQVLATNGWARTTMPFSLMSLVSANPWPFPSLSIALDGAEFSYVNDTTAFVVLRTGQVYLLQYTNAWSLLPLFATVGALGQVANISSLSLGSISLSAVTNAKFLEKSKLYTGSKGDPVELGMLFVGSRLGDSSLLGYGLAKTSVAEAMKQEPGLSKTKMEGNETILGGETTRRVVDEEYDRILRMEEEALYAPTGEETTHGPDVVPPSDDDEDVAAMHGAQSASRRKRARLTQLTVVQTLTVLDSITALGPLGPGCIGPLSQGQSEVSETTGKAAPALGATGYIYPCGFGSSGGLALLTVPGRDDRTIMAEEDCINAKALFNLPTRGLVLLSMSDCIRFMKLEGVGPQQTLVEVDMTEWTSKELRSLFKTCELLAACERSDSSFCLLMGMKVDEKSITYALLVIDDKNGNLTVETNIPLPVPEGEAIRSVAPMIRQGSSVTFGYTMSTGEAKIVTLEANGGVQGFSFEALVPMDMDDDKGVTAEEKFYAWGTVAATDIFKAPKAFFSQDSALTTEKVGEDKSKAGPTDPQEGYDFDDEDKALYTETASSDKSGEDPSVDETVPQVNLDEEDWFVAIVRQSGMLEIYRLEDLTPGREVTASWSSPGCSHGAPLLTRSPPSGSAYRTPQQHQVQTSEIRFFSCGPSKSQGDNISLGPQSFCLALETSDGDVMLYRAELDPRRPAIEAFRRIALKAPARPSKEQDKHFTKLRRKGIVKNSGDDVVGGFRHNSLFRFQNLSRQDGLFAATARPMWFIAERGRPSMLYHRCRHMAPSGAKTRPVAGFCAGILKSDGGEPGFMTLHERVGRVGSQRLTVFTGILNLTSAHGVIPGGGYFIEKLPMGVTVRQIQFIDNPAVCASRPLYAVLVSREIDEDMSALNDDGLTPEERERLSEEKENAKIKRQVEADLGGFDIEQEWVEEIEREDCFKVDTDLGGAPPISRSAYSLWIVDAASGWVVVDSYEFDEFEHGLTMQVMPLSEFMAEPGSSTMDTPEEDLETRMFITVGTGIVDKDGEDVCSKGRIVLLELNKPSLSSAIELNFVYEKKIFHGPVNSLSCLSSEGKYRLIIGAGADVNVEQWGNDKLTQVGFFRATMHVLDIKLFKNFFLLSDAYDSLYFLVWRESDKSLTLLAKDYDPIPVYAAGLLSRGGSLDMVCHDDRQNLQFFQYAPGDAAARGGNKLVCRADFHLGSQTVDLQSHFCRNSLLVASATPASTIAALQQQDAFFGRTDDDQRLGVHFGTTDGEYGAIIPLSEPVYWRLTALQSVMTNALESDCALSQRAWRLYRRSARRGGCRSNERKKGVIDGNLVIQYADLAVADQEDLASAIGSTVDLILDNLLELRCSVMVI